MLAIANYLVGCSSEKEQTATPKSDDTLAVAPADSTAYADWLTRSHQRVRFHYPDFHPQMGSLHDMAEAFTATIERCARFFNMTPPDTVDIYFYTGPGQSEEMTGSVYPFATEDAIHFTLPSFYGPPVVQYLLKKWYPPGPKYPFLKHGVISLLDHSGQNYHQSTLDYIAADSLIPLRELARDTTIDSNKERYQSALAASFVDYLTLRYGLGSFRALYTTSKPFDEAVRSTVGRSVDELQAEWLRFVETAIDAMKQNDTTFLDSIVNERGAP